jgi:hypothetical protein
MATARFALTTRSLSPATQRELHPDNNLEVGPESNHAKNPRNFAKWAGLHHFGGCCVTMMRRRGTIDRVQEAR